MIEENCTGDILSYITVFRSLFSNNDSSVPSGVLPTMKDSAADVWQHLETEEAKKDSAADVWQHLETEEAKKDSASDV
ncbi:hypothetical protein PoB_005430100 [Plakobranchus ocellatus]|uniref:Uncharacterized protein n=1 Tax=Plakobranchus ocellatus TaxID=259542 RepID=A0AAV4C8Y7_9GAST|nr:hypothetical protein PoB_005430100 [Plakobranchus ocellatus]